MLDVSAVWLVPGLHHPVFARCADFFGTLFRRFESIDYRALYLNQGGEQLRAAIRETIAKRPELLVYTQFPSSYSYISPPSLGMLRRHCRVIGLGFDDEIYFEQAKYFYRECDAVITSDVDDAEQLRSSGMRVHIAQFQQPAAGPDDNGTEDIPVSFVGDMTKPGRQELVRALRDAGIEVADYGKGSRGGVLSDAEVIQVFRRSRINLNFTRTNPPSWILRNHPQRAAIGQIKGRPFDLAAMRKFCLCEWAPCVDHWFKPEVEIGVFKNIRQLVAAVKKYSTDHALRARVASAAYERYRAQYEPRSQFERIFLRILADGSRLASANSKPSADIFYESMGRSRAVSFLHALRRGRPLRALAETLQQESSRASYWRGFVGGLKDTVTNQLSH